MSSSIELNKIGLHEDIKRDIKCNGFVVVLISFNIKEHNTFMKNCCMSLAHCEQFKRRIRKDWCCTVVLIVVDNHKVKHAMAMKLSVVIFNIPNCIFILYLMKVIYHSVSY